MRILHINTARTWRGGEQQTFYLARGLHEKGFQVYTAVPPGSALFERLEEAGLNAIPMSMRGELNFFAISKLSRLIRRLRIDLVHCHTSHAHTLGTLAAHFSGRKPHTVVHRRVDFSIYKSAISPLARLKYNFNVTRYIAVSNAIKRVMEADGIDPEKITVINSSVDPERFLDLKPVNLRRELKMWPDDLLVGNVGALVDHKGQEHFIRAAAKVLNQFPQARFVLVGDGTLRNKLEKLADNLGLLDDGRIIFMGFRRDAIAVMKNFDVFVMSSVEEGLGSVVLEAMMLDIPIVSTTAGGLPEILSAGQDALLVKPADYKALADAVCLLLSDRRIASQLADNAKKKVVSEFSADRMVDKTIGLYEEIARLAK